MPFSYTHDQASTLHHILRQKGLSEAGWPSQLQAITQAMKMAMDLTARRPLYASQAAAKLDDLVKALHQPLQAYGALESEPDVQSALDEHLAAASMLQPLLMASFSHTERSVVERLLSGGRFAWALKLVQLAAALAAEPLLAGQPTAIPKATLKMLPPDVAKIVMAQNGARRKSIRGFPVTGAPKDQAFRFAVPSLMVIYQGATGKRPTMSVSQHEKKEYASAFEERGYSGGFYQFAAAALGPVRLVPKGQSLGAKIHMAYKEFLPTIRPSSKKRVKPPSPSLT
jgi:hypothetical protein